MAAIMILHMMNTATQFANDHTDIGIVRRATGLCMFVAPQSRRSQLASARAQMPAAVHGCARIRPEGDAVKFASAFAVVQECR